MFDRDALAVVFCCCVCDLMQALAKIAVRSGEPFRVQCYSILATAAGGSVAHMNRSNRGSSTAAAGNQGAAAYTAAGQAAAAASAAAAAESTAGDPLGIAAVVGPALEVLDHMYASKCCAASWWPPLHGQLYIECNTIAWQALGNAAQFWQGQLGNPPTSIRCVLFFCLYVIARPPMPLEGHKFDGSSLLVHLFVHP
jgi:hypothetical protein